MPALLTGEISDRDAFYSAYVSTYLERDVRQLTQVGDLLSFRRCVAAAAARTGQLLNLSDLAKDTDVSVPTARSWLSVLAASWQVYLLQPLHSNVTKRLVKTPKLYMLDTGLCSWLTGWSTPETLASGAMSGAIFETWVLSEILKSWWHRMREPALWFYRDRDRREIDLVFERDGQLYPVEIKRGATPRRGWTRTFSALDRFEGGRGDGAVVCLTPRPVPLERGVSAINVGTI